MVNVERRADRSHVESTPDRVSKTQVRFKETKRRERRRRLLKAAAALALMAVVAVAALFATNDPRPVSDGATASSNRTETDDAAKTHALLYLQPLNRQHTVDEYAWSGKKVRTVHTAVPFPLCLAAAGGSMEPCGFVVDDSIEVGPLLVHLRPFRGAEAPEYCLRDHIPSMSGTDQTRGEAGQLLSIGMVHTNMIPQSANSGDTANKIVERT
jgi:hypothetical protein